MISVLLRKECREWWRDGRLRLLLLILLLLAIGSVLNASQQARSQHAAVHAASAGEQQRWLDQEEKHPHSAAHYGVYAFRPPGPLAAFDAGLEPYLPVTVWMEAHRQNQPLYRPAQDAGSAGRFMALTPAVIVGALLPLLLLLLAAPAICGERERGTLRLLLAQGVPPRRIVLGKALALLLLLAVLLLPGWLLGAGLLLAMGHGSDALLRWALLGMAAGIFLIGFLLFCLWVSALCRQSRTALLILLGVWAGSTLVAPRLVMETAEWRHPTPSAQAFRQEIEAGLAAVAPELDAALSARADALLAEHGVDRLEDLPVNFAAVRLQKGEDYGDRVFDAVFGRLHDGYLAQERWLQAAGTLAPFLAFSSVSSGLAGSDLLHFRHFIEQAEQHRRLIQRRMNDAIYAQPEGESGPVLAGPELWATVPAFEFRPLTLAAALPNYALAITALLLWLLLPLVLLWRVAGRLTP